MNLRDELATILDDHQLSVEPVASEPDLRAHCSGCGWQLDVYTTDSARWEHASHVADLQIAYLRDNLAEHGDELGATQEWAVLNPAGAVMTVPDNSRTNAQKMAALVPSPLISRFVTDWSRADA